jgi:hypothetical protein
LFDFTAQNHLTGFKLAAFQITKKRALKSQSSVAQQDMLKAAHFHI